VWRQARDPIPQFRKWALESGLLTEAQIQEINQSVTDVVEESVKFADESPKPVRSLAARTHACRERVRGRTQHRQLLLVNRGPSDDVTGARMGKWG
jgi:TPP-dependent pyruvate/acetoin dehydrogenase alpha subunit